MQAIYSAFLKVEHDILFSDTIRYPKYRVLRPKTMQVIPEKDEQDLISFDTDDVADLFQKLAINLKG